MSRHKVQVRRVYDDPARGDGNRVLVDRIWPRGMTKQKAHLEHTRRGRIVRRRCFAPPVPRWTARRDQTLGGAPNRPEESSAAVLRCAMSHVTCTHPSADSPDGPPAQT